MGGWGRFLRERNVSRASRARAIVSFFTRQSRFMRLSVFSDKPESRPKDAIDNPSDLISS